MTNAVAIRQPQMAAEVTTDSMFQMANAIANGRLFGSQDPNAVFTLMLLAQAEGKHPGLVMRDYHVINGKPAKKADAMLVDFLASGGKVEWHALTDELADATFSHPAGGKVRISWDDKRVQAAQLGGNPMHKKYPRQMKRARVISEGVRTVYPGATGGLYVPEEVADFDDAPAAAPVHEVRAEPGTPAAALNEAVADATLQKVRDWARERIASVPLMDREALTALQNSRKFGSAMHALDEAEDELASELRKAVGERWDALEANG